MGELPQDLKVAKKQNDEQNLQIEFGDGNEDEEELQKKKKPKQK